METEEESEGGEKEADAEKKEEQDKTEPPLEDDAKKHGFLILSREDSTMVTEETYSQHSDSGTRKGEKRFNERKTSFSLRSCRRVRRSWSWTPVALPLRDPLCLLETLEITNTSSRSPPWDFGFLKEVK